MFLITMSPVKKRRKKKKDLNPRTVLGRAATLSQVAATLGRFRRLGYEQCALRIRTVAFKLEGEWHNFGTVGTLEQSSTVHKKLIELRDDVALYESCEPIDETLSAKDLAERFFYWRTAVRAPEACTFQDHLYVNRTGSDHVSGAWPYWQMQLYETGKERKNYSPPDGPFLHAKEGVFAPNLPDLAGFYLGQTLWTNQANSTNHYSLCIPDRRARFEKIDLSDTDLRIGIERHTGVPTYLCVRAFSQSVGEFRAVSRINRHAKARLSLGFSPSELSLWITLDDGYALDHYVESVRRDSRSGQRGVLKKASQSGGLSALQDLLIKGETQTVEFKPYVRFKRGNEKREEILETICAFANAEGGSLFIGVDRNGAPEGIELDLARDYGAKCADSETCLKDSYLRDLRKLLSEGLTRSIPIQFDWHDMAHHWILEVQVPSSSEIVGLLNGKGFHRVNGTNQLLKLHEITSGK